MLMLENRAVTTNLSTGAAHETSKARKWAGRIMRGLVIVLLALDSVMKFVQPAPVIEASQHLGLPLSLSPVFGAILLTCVVLYAIPRTSVLGAMLLTGYFGGAVLTHLRVGDPLFSHVLSPVYMGVIAWGGIYLNNARLRALFSWE